MKYLLINLSDVWDFPQKNPRHVLREVSGAKVK